MILLKLLRQINMYMGIFSNIYCNSKIYQTENFYGLVYWYIIVYAKNKNLILLMHFYLNKLNQIFNINYICNYKHYYAYFYPGIIHIFKNAPVIEMLGIHLLYMT